MKSCCADELSMTVVHDKINLIVIQPAASAAQCQEGIIKMKYRIITSMLLASLVLSSGCSQTSRVSDTIRPRDENAVLSDTTSEQENSSSDFISSLLGQKNPWAQTDTSQMILAETTYDADGTPLFQKVYGYDSNGLLRLIVTLPSESGNYQGYILQSMDYDNETKTETNYPSYSADVVQNISDFPGFIKQSRTYGIGYSSDGNPEHTVWNVELTSDEAWSVDRDACTAESSTAFISYNENGEILNEVIALFDETTVNISYTYDDQGRVTQWRSSISDDSKENYSIYEYERSGSEESFVQKDGYTNAIKSSGQRTYYSVGGDWEDVLQSYGSWLGTWVSPDNSHILLLTTGEIYMLGSIDDETGLTLITEYGTYTISSESEASTDSVLTHIGWLDGQPEIEKTTDLRLEGDTLYYGDDVYFRQ